MTSSHIFTLVSISALKEFARFRPEAIKSVTVKEPSQRLVAELIEAGVPRASIKTARDLGHVSGPLVAQIQMTQLSEDDLLSALSESKPRLIVALDHITDPRNLGAIARSAAFFGVPFLIAPERRQAPLTDAAFQTAQGAFALTQLVSVTNLGRSLESLKELGFWVVGTDMGGEVLQEVAGFYDHTVLVLGSEDKGMAQKIREKCDRTVAIGGVEGGLDSLNVSVAAGIALHAFARPVKGR